MRDTRVREVDGSVEPTERYGFPMRSAPAESRPEVARASEQAAHQVVDGVEYGAAYLRHAAPDVMGEAERFVHQRKGLLRRNLARAFAIVATTCLVIGFMRRGRLPLRRKAKVKPALRSRILRAFR